MSAPNPYERDGKWYWFDETEDESPAYSTKVEALVDLELYGHYLNTGIDLRERIIAEWRGKSSKAISRLEVIGENGRMLTIRPAQFELSYQDGGRTLKVFVTRTKDTHIRMQA